MRILIFDTGTLINLSMNGLLYILEELKKITDVKFLITSQVKHEIIDRPINIPRFELGALRLKKLLDTKILELPESLKIKNSEIKVHLNEFMQEANTCVRVHNKPIKIVSEAEVSCLALSKILTDKKIANIIAVDERTIRILTEKPQNLESLMSRKLHRKVEISHANLKHFKQFRFIRSTELVYVAHKKNLLRLTGKKALEAAIYATKFKGAAISWDELNVLKKL